MFVSFFLLCHVRGSVDGLVVVDGAAAAAHDGLSAFVVASVVFRPI